MGRMAQHSTYSDVFSNKKAPFAFPLVMFESTSAVSTHFIIVAILVALLIIVVLYMLHRHQQKTALESVDPLERPSFIRAILTSAIDERCRMDIFLSNGMRLSRSLTGFCVELGTKNMFINTGAISLPANIQTLPLTIYFFLNRGTEKIFYSFTGILCGVSNVGGQNRLELPIPNHLTNAQKRDFVRICPGPGMVEAVVLWKNSPAAEQSTLPPDAKQLGAPHFSYRPPHAVQTALINISGGGVLLRLAGERLQQIKAQYVLGDSFIVLVLLHDLETDKILTIWISACCRRVVRAESTANIELGLQFTHWALAEKPSAPITWHAVQLEGEVPPILTWTLRVQSFLSRTTS